MHPACAQCGRYRYCTTPKLMGTGSWSPRVVFVTANVTKADDTAGVAYDASNPWSEEFKKYLGATEYDCYFTAASKCFAFGDVILRDGYRPPSPSEVSACSLFLSKELNGIAGDPPLMVLGVDAYTAITGKGPMDGGVAVGYDETIELHGKQRRIIVNYHPSELIADPSKAHTFAGILARVLPDIPITPGQKTKTLGPGEAIAFLSDLLAQYRDGKIAWTLFDIETSSLLPWDGEVIMYSFAHAQDMTAYSIPLTVSNDFKLKREKVFEMYGLDNEIRLFKAELAAAGRDPKEVIGLIESHTAKLYDNLKEREAYGHVVSLKQRQAINRLVVEICHTIPLVGHNLKFDLKWMYVHFQLDLSKVRVHADTIIMAHQMFAREAGKGKKTSMSLKDLCRKFFTVAEDWDAAIDKFLVGFKIVDRSFANIPTKILGEYSALDAYYNKMLFVLLDRMFPEHGRMILSEITRAIVPYVEAECKGIDIDDAMLETLKVSYTKTLADYRVSICSLPQIAAYIDAKVEAMGEKNRRSRKPKTLPELREKAFNPKSPKQLGELVYSPFYFAFQPLKSKKGKTKAGKASTGEGALLLLAKEENVSAEAKTFIKTLLSWRGAAKIFSDYIMTVPEKKRDGNFKTEFKLTGTVTGRFASGLHTMPRESDIKRLYRTRWAEDGGLFCTPDMSQLEVRIGASLAGEENLINAYRNGIDIHAQTAAAMFRKPLGEVTDSERSSGKGVNFAIFYGKSAYTLAADLGLPLELTEQMLRNFFDGNPTLKAWVEEQQRNVMRDKSVRTAMGRTIAIPEAEVVTRNPAMVQVEYEMISTKITETKAKIDVTPYPDKGILIYRLKELFARSRETRKELMSIGDAHRRAVNFPVQSAASDAVTIGANHIYYENKKAGLNTIFLGTVHDSIILDVYPGELFTVLRRVKSTMEVWIRERFPWIKCPLVIDITLGVSWKGSLKVSLTELSEEHAVFEASGYRADFHAFVAAAEKAYDVVYDVRKTKALSAADFDADSLFRDEEKWTAVVKMSMRKNS